MTRLLNVVALTLLGGCLVGCASHRELGDIGGSIDRIEQDTALVKASMTSTMELLSAIEFDVEASVKATASMAAEISTKIGDVTVNEPVTSWILALGYAAIVPGCFVIYVFSKRTKLYRRIAGADDDHAATCRRPGCT